MRAPRADPVATLSGREVAVALRDLIDLEDTETKPRDFGVRWVLEGVDDGTEMAGEKEEVATAIS